ncbi:hypothetical protein [Paraburkholderia elongata]|uniref:Uncharacterized protein n=1 Tax=Paraburkholderia elongata TaxID=2675747 RepID=A0A972NPN5_9BURK|nr:hypothetical protein [Paraburkholderia elongata]NPT56731.1 hypothetical protein [Paraburkholderia elongata]
MKAQKKLRERRVLFMSWIPDNYHLADRCVEVFKLKLTPIPCDYFDAPITVMESEPAGVPGAPTAPALKAERLYAVTDVVGFLTDNFFIRNGDAQSNLASEIGFFLNRKIDEQKAGQCGGLAMWIAPVDKLNLRRYPIITTRLSWWHQLLPGKPRFSTDHGKEEYLKDEVEDAIELMLHHSPETCPSCAP